MLEERTEYGTAKQMITADEDFKLPHDDMQLLRVDLACGQNKNKDFIGMDNVGANGVDIVHDLMQFPWPFEDSSVYEFNCSHFVEHIPIQLSDGSYGLIRFMEEVWRCLMPGGTIKITCPFYTSGRAWQDPTHTRAITEVTFLYFNKKQAKAMNMDHYTGKCNFELMYRNFMLNPAEEAYADETRAYRMKHFWNVIDDIEMLLRKIDL